MPDLTIRRSTTTSMVWLRRRSSLMSSSSERNWPSMRALVKPRCRSACSSFLNSPLRPRTIGASTLMRASCRVEHHQVEDALERLRRDLAAAVVAVRHADVGEQQPQVVVDLGDRADGRARIRARWSSARWRSPATGLRSDRRPASPSARGTAGRRPTATRRSAAALRRRSCRRRATTCPTRTGR